MKRTTPQGTTRITEKVTPHKTGAELDKAQVEKGKPEGTPMPANNTSGMTPQERNAQKRINRLLLPKKQRLVRIRYRNGEWHWSVMDIAGLPIYGRVRGGDGKYIDVLSRINLTELEAGLKRLSPYGDARTAEPLSENDIQHTKALIAEAQRKIEVFIAYEDELSMQLVCAEYMLNVAHLMAITPEVRPVSFEVWRGKTLLALTAPNPPANNTSGIATP
jgi:hypothetical protein